MKNKFSILIMIPIVFAFACSTAKGPSKTETDAVAARLADFYRFLKVIEDPLYKEAALKEDAEPGKAREYFDAHEKLREMMADPEQKPVILAAFLQNDPTDARPIGFELQGDALTVTLALGPTDQKTGRMLLRKKAEAWLIEDFDGVVADRAAVRKTREQQQAASATAQTQAETKADTAANPLATGAPSDQKTNSGLTAIPATQ